MVNHRIFKIFLNIKLQIHAGETPRLIPMDEGPEVRQSVTTFRHLLQQVEDGPLTTGAVLHPEMLKNPKSPFFGPVRNVLASK